MEAVAIVLSLIVGGFIGFIGSENDVPMWITIPLAFVVGWLIGTALV
jgi:hypothetical protein